MSSLIAYTVGELHCPFKPFGILLPVVSEFLPETIDIV
jgi:hypothetical protein